MKHVVIHVLGITESKIDADTSYSKGSSHSFLINKILTHLKSSKKEWKEFNNNIADLKTMRNDADYSDSIDIDKLLSKKSIELSEAVLKVLRTL